MSKKPFVKAVEYLIAENEKKSKNHKHAEPAVLKLSIVDLPVCRPACSSLKLMQRVGSYVHRGDTDKTYAI